MSRKTKSHEMDMCNGPVLKKMLIFAIPVILSGVLQLLFNAADIMVVGKYAGENSLAAVGSTTYLVNMFVNFFIGLSIAANVLAARFYAGGQEKELSDTVHTSIAVSLVSGVVLALLGVFFAPVILKWMGTPSEIIGPASVYLRVYFLGMPAMMVYNFGAAILRSVGDTKRPMYFLTAAGIINVVFNLFFVIVLKWDVLGVAVATTISQIVSAVCIVICLTKETGAIRLVLSEIRIDKKTLGSILRIGIPAGIQASLFQLANITVQSAVNSFGSVAVAGNAAAANLESFTFTSMYSFYQACISFGSQNIGQKKYNRLNRILFTAMGCAVVLGLIMGNIFHFADSHVLSLYTDSAEVIKWGAIRLSIVSACHFTNGMMETAVGMLKGMGYSIFPTVISFLGSCVFRIVWVNTVFRMPQFHRIEMVYIVYPISWTVTAAVQVAAYFYLKRKQEKEALAAA